MRTKTLALASALALAASGAALAQTPAGGGRTEGNMNNPGSVKSTGQTNMERSMGTATGNMGATGSPADDVTGSTGGRMGGAGTGMGNSTGGAAGGSGAGAR